MDIVIFCEKIEYLGTTSYAVKMWPYKRGDSRWGQLTKKGRPLVWGALQEGNYCI